MPIEVNTKQFFKGRNISDDFRLTPGGKLIFLDCKVSGKITGDGVVICAGNTTIGAFQNSSMEISCSDNLTIHLISSSNNLTIRSVKPSDYITQAELDTLNNS